MKKIRINSEKVGEKKTKNEKKRKKKVEILTWPRRI